MELGRLAELKTHGKRKRNTHRARVRDTEMETETVTNVECTIEGHLQWVIVVTMVDYIESWLVFSSEQPNETRPN